MRKDPQNFAAARSAVAAQRPDSTPVGRPEASLRPFEPPVTVLVGGGPRSGTTLMVDLLNEHPQVGILSEYVFDNFVRVLDPLLDRERLIASRALPPAVAPAKPVQPSSESAKPPVSRTNKTYGLLVNAALRFPKRFPTREDFPQLLSNVIATSLGKHGLRVIGAKDPFFTLHHDRDFLDDRVGLPVRYLLLLRNPIGQINSSLNRRNLAAERRDRWHIQTVHDAIHEYRSMCLLNFSYLVHFKDEAMLVKHEDLISDPTDTLRHVYRFLGLRGHIELGNLKVRDRHLSVMNEDEVRAVESSYAQASRDWESRPVTATKNPAEAFRGLVELYPRPFNLTLRPGVTGRPLLGLGWCPAFLPEGALSRGTDAYLVFALAEDGETSISLTLRPMFEGNFEEFECAILVDDEKLSTIRWQADDSASEKGQSHSSDNAPFVEFVGTDPHTVEIGPIHLSAGIPHTVRLSLSPGARVSLSTFALK